MAEEEDQQSASEIASVEKALKSNGRLLISLLVALLIIISILATSLVVINLQMAERNEVPAEEFVDQLAQLQNYLTHMIELHDAEAKAYGEYEAALGMITEQLQHEKLNELRQVMIQQGRDQQKFLSLAARGVESLAAMMPGDRAWVAGYQEKIKLAGEAIGKREEALRQSMLPPEVAEGSDAPSGEASGD